MNDIETQIESKINEATIKVDEALALIRDLQKQLLAKKSPSKGAVDPDTINEWEDVAKAWGLHPAESLPYPKPKDGDEENTNAYFMAKKLVKLINADESFPDFNNHSQHKHTPWFNMESSSGVGFSVSSCGNWYSGSDVGARLQWKNKDQMFDFFKKPGILKIWKTLMH